MTYIIKLSKIIGISYSEFVLYIICEHQVTYEIPMGTEKIKQEVNNLKIAISEGDDYYTITI